MSEYRLTRDAEADLLDLFLYGIETFGLVQAENYQRDLTTCFKLLGENPRLGRSAHEFAHGARRHEHARHIIFYDDRPDGVLITAIVHARSIRGLLR